MSVHSRPMVIYGFNLGTVNSVIEKYGDDMFQKMLSGTYEGIENFICCKDGYGGEYCVVGKLIAQRDEETGLGLTFWKDDPKLKDDLKLFAYEKLGINDMPKLIIFTY